MVTMSVRTVQMDGRMNTADGEPKNIVPSPTLTGGKGITMHQSKTGERIYKPLLSLHM